MNENTEKYIQLIKTLDPDLYELKVALLETGVNHMVLLHLIRSLAIIKNGSGYGDIAIRIEDSKVGLVKATETVAVNLPIVG